MTTPSSDPLVQKILESYISHFDSGKDPVTEEFLQRCETPGQRTELAQLISDFVSLRKLLPEPEGTPEKVGGFTILREIGRGGMGVVFAAEDARGNRVALKMLPDSLVLDPANKRRFERETTALASLDHPHIVRGIEYGDDQGRHYLVMSLLEGGSLEERILAQRKKPATESEILDTCRILARIARAAHSAHEKGIVHRDIKPSNILFDEEGQPYLADFGLAHLQTASTLTSHSKVLGTPAYLAPERLFDPTAGMDPRVDVYSLGVTLYESVARRRPFDGSMTQILASIRQGPPPTQIVTRSLRLRLEAIFGKALAEFPADRYPSALALADDLEALVAGKTVKAMRGHLWRKAKRSIRRRPLVYAASVFALALVATAFYLERSARLERAGIAMEFARGHLTQFDALFSKLKRVEAENKESGRHLWKQGEEPGANLLLESDLYALADMEEATVKESMWADRFLRDALREVPGHAEARSRFQSLHEGLARHWQHRGQLEKAELAWQASRDFAPGLPLPLASLEVRGNQRAKLRFSKYQQLTSGIWPLEEHPLPEPGPTFLLEGLHPGSYLLEFQREGQERWIRHPLLLKRGERITIDSLHLPTDVEIGEGWEYIPAGNFLAGGDQRASHPEPFEERFVEGFFMKRREVTCGEYLEFLEDLRQRGQACLFPPGTRNLRILEDIGLHSIHLPHDKTGPRYRIVEGSFDPQERAHFLPDRAIHLLCYEDADHYVRWLNQRAKERGESWVYSLPTSDQWEKAARGADGRHFTWGDRFDWDCTAGGRSPARHPHMAPGRFPEDTSPYGIEDMVGNVREFCRDYDASRELYLIRGGEESFYEPNLFRLAGRRGALVNEVNWDFGIRLVQTRRTSPK